MGDLNSNLPQQKEETMSPCASFSGIQKPLENKYCLKMHLSWPIIIIGLVFKDIQTERWPPYGKCRHYSWNNWLSSMWYPKNTLSFFIYSYPDSSPNWPSFINLSLSSLLIDIRWWDLSSCWKHLYMKRDLYATSSGDLWEYT